MSSGNFGIFSSLSRPLNRILDSILDFPGSSDGKASVYQCGRPGFDPWIRTIPWRRKWQPTPVLLPRKSHGWRSLLQTTVHGVTKSQTRLSDFTLSILYHYKLALRTAFAESSKFCKIVFLSSFILSYFLISSLISSLTQCFLSSILSNLMFVLFPFFTCNYFQVHTIAVVKYLI